MSQDLVLFPLPDGGLRWSLIDDPRDAAARAASGDNAVSLQAHAGLETVGRTIIVLPCEDVFATQVVLPTRSEREARQAAPFLVEEELASRLEEVEVIIGAPDADGQRWVFAAAVSRIAAWRELCEPFLHGSVHTVPDCLLIAEDDAALSLRYERGRVLHLYGKQARESGRAAGGACDSRMFDVLLPGLAASVPEGPLAVSPALGLAGESIRPLRDLPLDLAASALTESHWKQFPPLISNRSGAGPDWLAAARVFARAAALAAALLLCAGLYQIGDGLYLRHQASRYDAVSVERVQQAFPGIAGTLDPARARRILDDRLSSQQGGEGGNAFLRLLAALSTLSADHDAIEIQAVRFDISRPELSISARYPEFSDFDAMGEDARGRNIEIIDQGARDGSAGVDGDFILRVP
ncbi:type II secretion system protein GspL [Maricaulis sp.]|uniref:type II secretion system protein GspL n=1 Tax=Maricaulis sp. TaxID=1486257 RepID=UPI003A956957